MLSAQQITVICAKEHTKNPFGMSVVMYSCYRASEIIIIRLKNIKTNVLDNEMQTHVVIALLFVSFQHLLSENMMKILHKNCVMTSPASAQYTNML